jgi:hypothetical protein
MLVFCYESVEIFSRSSSFKRQQTPIIILQHGSTNAGVRIKRNEYRTASYSNPGQINGVFHFICFPMI